MMLPYIKALSARILPEVVRIRRHLHQHPELSFQEYATSDYIKSQLDEIGVAWRPIAGTGVLATIEGESPASNAVALRADIDALPIQEMNPVEDASKNPGDMHACRHDFRSSSLVGTSLLLPQMR